MKKFLTVVSCIFIALLGFSLMGTHTIWGIILIVFAIFALIGGLAPVNKDGKPTLNNPIEDIKTTIPIEDVKKPNQKKTPSIIKIIGFVFLFLFVIGIIGSFLDDGKSSKIKSLKGTELKSNKEKPSKTNVQPEEKAVEPVKNTKYQWQYADDVDQMTSRKRYFSMIYSMTWLSFKFPYNGGSEAWLTVRNMDGDNEILLNVTKGQFISSYDYSKSLRIRFDNEQPIDVFYTSPSDGSITTIFLDSADQLIKRLKKAHSFIIEVQFYHEGNQLLSFSYEDFSWKH